MLAVLAAAVFAPSPVQVTPPDFAEAREAQVAIDGDHEIYIAYGLGDAIYVSTSNDQGVSYTAPVKVAATGNLALGMRRGPRIAANNGLVTITASYGGPGRRQEMNLLAFRSTDRGMTWNGPVRINDLEGSAREGLHAMAAAPDGRLACAWLDLRSKGTKLYLSTSKIGGASWSENRLVYTSPGGSICECCHPSLAFDRNGKLFVMFRNSIQGARDMYLTSSIDLGRTFAPAVKLGQGTWMLTSCPMDGGSLDLTPGGDVTAVWRREGTLYRSGSAGAEQMLAEGRQGWLANGTDGSYIVWSEGRRLLASTPSERVSELSSDANDGVVASSPDRKLILAAWTENGIRSVRLSGPTGRSPAQGEKR